MTQPALLPPGRGAGLLLAQPERGYRYSLDAFLLAGWCRPRRGERILDLGAGAGVIGLLLARRCPSVRVLGIELNEALARHAAANARANGLDRRVFVVRADLRGAPRYLPAEHFDRVVANPPFYAPGSGLAPPDPARAEARHGSTFSLADLSRTAAALLRYGGTVDVIQLPQRLPELWRAFAASGLEPKQLQLLSPRPDAPPRLCLVSAVKGARPGLRVLPGLVLHRPGGQLTREALALLAGEAPPRPAAAKKRQSRQ